MKIAPPLPAATLFPCAKVRSEMSLVVARLLVTWNMRELSLPLMVRGRAPGPWMMTFRSGLFHRW